MFPYSQYQQRIHGGCRGIGHYQEIFHVSPRTIKSCRDWQELSSGYRFHYVELNLGRDYSLLGNLQESISAMKDVAHTGSSSFDFDGVPIPDDYADAGDTTQKRSKTKSVIDSFSLQNGYQHRNMRRTQEYFKKFQEFTVQFALSLEVSRYCAHRSTRFS